MSWRINHGDCVTFMKQLPDSCIDAIVCDPPYELSFGQWVEWDRTGVQFSVNMWKEALRVLKPGAHALIFGATKKYHRLGYAVEEAGLEIIDSIHWVHGSGFPKSLDIAKAIDKRNGVWRGRAGAPLSSNKSMGGPNYERTDKGDPVTDAAKQWDGWGTALKPAHEPIMMVRRGIDGVIIDNVMEHGTGGINIDACRVGSERRTNQPAGNKPGGNSLRMSLVGMPTDAEPTEVMGRWPANFVLTHSAACRKIDVDVVPGDARAGRAMGKRPGGFASVGADSGDSMPNARVYGDEELSVYECAPECPVAALDVQSGIRRSGSRKAGVRKTIGYGEQSKGDGGPAVEGSNGTASRFFPVFEWDPDTDFPFMYCAKASPSERDEGLDALPERIADPYAQHRGRRMEDKSRFDGKPPKRGRNIHPTVKPINLLRWLCRLITPPGGIILDPFMGSGSTGIAAIREGFRFLGYECEFDYYEIAMARLQHERPQRVGI